jgi:hypothetical protein
MLKLALASMAPARRVTALPLERIAATNGIVTLGRARVVGMVGVERLTPDNALAVHDLAVGDVIHAGVAGDVANTRSRDPMQLLRCRYKVHRLCVATGGTSPLTPPRRACA